MASAVALNGGSGRGDAPSIVGRSMIVARLEVLPRAPAVIDVRRAVFPPAAVASMMPEDGPLAMFVDSGAVTVRIAGEAVVTRAALPGEIACSVPLTGDGTITLRYGDQLLIAAETAVRAINDGAVPAELVVVHVSSVSTGLPRMPRMADGPTAAWELLAQGVFTNMPSSPAYLEVSRIVYAGDAHDAAPAMNAGPLLITIERGAIGYRPSTGQSSVVLAGGEGPVPVPPGEEVVLVAGTYAIEAWGTVSSVRNATTDRAWILLTTLVEIQDSPPSTSIGA
jgi:hypothetical protein